MKNNLPNQGNLIPFTIDSATAAVNRLSVRQAGAFRSMRRFVYQNPFYRQQFEQQAGFDNVFAGDAIWPRSMTAIERVASMQSAFILDRIANGDIEQIPALETIFEVEKDNNNLIRNLIAILEECCETIQKKIDSLRDFITRKFKQFFNLIEHQTNDSINFLKQLFSSLFDLYDIEKANLNDFYQAQRTQALQHIKFVIQQELKPFKDDLVEFKRESRRTLQSIQNDGSDIKQKVNSIQNTVNSTQNTIQTIAADVGIIVSDLAALTGAFSVFLEDFTIYVKPVIVETSTV